MESTGFTGCCSSLLGLPIFGDGSELPLLDPPIGLDPSGLAAWLLGNQCEVYKIAPGMLGGVREEFWMRSVLDHICILNKSLGLHLGVTPYSHQCNIHVTWCRIQVSLSGIALGLRFPSEECLTFIWISSLDLRGYF